MKANIQEWTGNTLKSEEKVRSLFFISSRYFDAIFISEKFKELQKSRDRCTGRHNITEILLKTMLHTIQSIIPKKYACSHACLLTLYIRQFF